MHQVAKNLGKAAGQDESNWIDAQKKVMIIKNLLYDRDRFIKKNKEERSRSKNSS